MAITTRAGKGSPLTHEELDTNITDLRDGVGGRVYPKEQGNGNKVDISAPTFAWQDLLGHISLASGGVPADHALYIGGIRAFSFTEGDEAHVSFHIPHDYVMGTEIFLHFHWSHNATTVTGGSVTWGAEITYAKSHSAGAFHTTKLLTVSQNAHTTRYQHLLAETSASANGGTSTQLDTALLEPDGIIMCKIYLDSNDITVSGGGIPEPFLHFVDVHYQSTGLGTKQKNPNFWA